MPPTIDEAHVARLADVFRTLADPARLRILGALADAPRTGAELSTLLGLTPPTISHHIAKLAGAGLISTTPDAQRRIYALDTETFRSLARAGSATAMDTPSATSSGDASERERAKTLRDFFDGDTLKQIPAQRRKRVFVLQHLLERFTPGTEYPERAVNEILKVANPDFATLRRELVDYGFMTRESGIYQVAASLPIRGPNVAQEIPGNEHDWLRTVLDRALGTPKREI